mgnify:FL=1|tara:strand:- start:74 stop:766 length:693 start_codon:yes stop_codon:yes gene_type:complete
MITPSIIEPFSYIWWVGIIISVLSIIIIIQLGIRIPPDQRKILMYSIGFLLILVEVIQQIYLYGLDLWALDTSLPIHLCGISGILAGVIFFRPKQIGFEFLALMGTAGALHGILTPQLNHGYIPFLIYKYYISHAGIILVPLFLAIVQGFRIKILAWLRVAILCQILVIFLAIVNYVVGANYMYLSEKPLVNNPMIIGEWPWYILGFELIGVIHILVFYFGYRRMKPLPY